MKKLFFITLLIFLVGVTGFSAETAKQKKIRDLFQVIDIQTNINEMSQMITDSGDKKLSADQRTAFQKEMEAMMNYIMDKQMELYDKRFTEQEIDEILNFYKTPTGKKILKETPEISKELFTDLIGNYYPDMIRRLEKIK